MMIRMDLRTRSELSTDTTVGPWQTITASRIPMLKVYVPRIGVKAVTG
jgi:hypothetical protein